MLVFTTGDFAQNTKWLTVSDFFPFKMIIMANILITRNGHIPTSYGTLHFRIRCRYNNFLPLALRQKQHASSLNSEA